MTSVPELCVTGMVNLDDYPVDDLESDRGVAFASTCRSQFLKNGLCMLPGFIRPRTLEILTGEINRCIGDAWFCKDTHSVYLAHGDDSGRQERTFVGSIAYDRIGENASLRRLYQWDPLKDFIRVVLGKQHLHRFADPLGACSVNVFVDGGEHGWHFDESEFAVTLMVQAPESGGSFEYVPRIRGQDDEMAIIESVLDGDRDVVQVLPFTAGALLIFCGRQTLHRVSRVSGSRPRLVPVLTFAEQPGLHNSKAVRTLFWGRTK